MLEIKWGVIIVVAGFVWVCVEYMFGLHGQHIELQPGITTLWIPFAALLLFVGLREKKRARDGHLSYWAGVRSAAGMAALVGLLTPPFLWIFFTFVNPEFFDAMIAHSVAAGVAPADAEAYFNQTNYLVLEGIGGAAGTLVSGFMLMFFLRSRAPRPIAEGR